VNIECRVVSLDICRRILEVDARSHAHEHLATQLQSKLLALYEGRFSFEKPNVDSDFRTLFVGGPGKCSDVIREVLNENRVQFKPKGDFIAVEYVVDPGYVSVRKKPNGASTVLYSAERELLGLDTTKARSAEAGVSAPTAPACVNLIRTKDGGRRMVSSQRQVLTGSSSSDDGANNWTTMFESPTLVPAPAPVPKAKKPTPVQSRPTQPQVQVQVQAQAQAQAQGSCRNGADEQPCSDIALYDIFPFEQPAAVSPFALHFPPTSAYSVSFICLTGE
jgi:hypothetical protein